MTLKIKVMLKDDGTWFRFKSPSGKEALIHKEAYGPIVAAALHETILAIDYELTSLRAEVERYKKAKQENDERFMIERDEARAEVESLRLELKMMDDAVAWVLTQNNVVHLFNTLDPPPNVDPNRPAGRYFRNEVRKRTGTERQEESRSELIGLEEA